MYQAKGLDAFQAHEATHARQAVATGPFKPLLEALHRLQLIDAEASRMRVRTALVTARSSPARARHPHADGLGCPDRRSLLPGGLAEGRIPARVRAGFLLRRPDAARGVGVAARSFRPRASRYRERTEIASAGVVVEWPWRWTCAPLCHMRGRTVVSFARLRHARELARLQRMACDHRAVCAGVHVGKLCQAQTRFANSPGKAYPRFPAHRAVRLLRPREWRWPRAARHADAAARERPAVIRYASRGPRDSHANAVRLCMRLAKRYAD